MPKQIMTDKRSVSLAIAAIYRCMIATFMFPGQPNAESGCVFGFFFFFFCTKLLTILSVLLFELGQAKSGRHLHSSVLRTRSCSRVYFNSSDDT